jgi:HD-GYP domain-containing protein (c-di-GMP phosphodiesterase class II)
MALRRLWLICGITALAAPALALAFFWLAPAHDPLMMHRSAHFWLVGGTAVAAAVAACIVIAASPTLRETRQLFLALAFLSIAGIFSVHGLMTPGQHFAEHYYSSVSVSSWVSVIAGSGFVALSVARLPRPAEEAVRRAGSGIFAWAAIVIAAYIAMSLTSDEWLDFVPTDDVTVQRAIAFASTLLFAFALYRYWQAYLFAQLPSQAAVVIALALLVQVPAILLWGTVWHFSWWMYHGLYAIAFAVLFAGWAIEVRRAGNLKVIADGLSMRDALSQLNRGRDAHVLELVDAIEAKDRATLGHVSRVSSYALSIGKQLNLSPQDLRALVLAAQMHDVGKIGVPDSILAKPGRLDEEEWAEVRKHAPRGDEIARRVDALRPLAPVIRAHHERLDGSGYPDRLRGDAIPVLARIIAVADTFDAMTSARPYRAPLDTDAALEELRRVRGIELDVACVDAFIASFGRQQPAAA